MQTVLPALAVAFAALCTWLAARIVNLRERWAKWTLAVTLCLPFLYLASFGPVCWWLVKSERFPHQSRSQPHIVIFVTPRLRIPPATVKEPPAFYSPIGWFYRRVPDFLRGALDWYFTLGLPKGEHIYLEYLEDDVYFAIFWDAAD